MLYGVTWCQHFGAWMAIAGVDVGGTFTDIVVFDGDTFRVSKVLTRVSKPWISVREAVEKLVAPSKLERLVHATTLGTNMLLGQVGLEKPRVVFVTSRGFRDIIEIGRQARPDPYNMFFEKPKPLVPRRDRFEINARIYRDGRITEPSIEEVEHIVSETCSSNTVYVVGLVNCFIKPSVEEKIAKLIGEKCKDAVVEWSCRVDPRPGEFERFSTTIVNALLRPMFHEYLVKLRDELKQSGFRGRLLIMQSSGGLAPPEAAEKQPVYFIESGPAAGAIASGFYAKLRGDDPVAAFDMGGTTAKASLIVGGEPHITDYFEVGGRFHAGRLVRGSGYPVRVPHVDLVEVSAGGGTIAWVDKGGGLRVGPLSAGAEPGPACYGRGGDEPTITDAHLLLGRLPETIAGGLLKLDHKAALRVYERLANTTGLDVYEAAAEVLRLANVEMARALRLVTVERGVDPSTITLYAFGGAGPLHAAELAAELDIWRVYIPPYAGVFSAVGLLVAKHSMTKMLPVTGVVNDRLLEETREISSREGERLAEKLGCISYSISVYLLLSYAGQGEALRIPVEGTTVEVVRTFEEEYRRSYGMLPAEPRPPIVSKGALLRVACHERVTPPRAPINGKMCCKRRVYFLSAEWVEAKVYRGMPAKALGPCIVELDTTTIVVPPGWRLEADEYGGALLEAL